MIGSFSKEYEVLYRDTGKDGKITIPSILNYFSNTSMLHVLKVKDSKDDIWVMNQWNLNIGTGYMPSFKDKLKITTWPKAFSRLYALREFCAYNEKDELIAKADIYVILMNIRERKLKTIDPETSRIWGCDISKNHEVKPLKLKPKEGYEDEFSIKVSNLDIDSLIHVYNVRYVEWAINSIPFEFLNGHRLKNMVVSYVKEAYINENIKIMVKCEKEDGFVKYYHKLYKEHDDTVVCLIESEWEDNNS